MKKIKLILTFLTFTVFLVSSCGNDNKSESSNSISVKPKSIELKGDLSDYFEVIDKEYNIPITDNLLDQLITVEIKRKDKDFAFNVDKLNPFGTNGGEEYHVGFGLELLGDNGPLQVNNATEGGMGGPYSSDDVLALLKLKKGETGFIRWTVDKTEGIKSFQITSALKKEDANASFSESASTDEDAFASTGDENWDVMLDDYEEYVDEYLKFYKKAMKGDANALSEYPALMEKATNLQNSMTEAQNDNKLSVEQYERMMKIQMKMLKAAQAQ